MTSILLPLSESFQLSRYNLEKKVQEQERQLHVQSSSRENYLTQVNQLEQNCLSVSKQASEVTEHVERLQANGNYIINFVQRR